MAPKNAIPQLLRRAVRSASQGSTTASITSSGVMTRSMAKVAAVIAMKQSVGTVPSQSRRIPSLDSTLLEGVNKVTSHHLKQKSVTGFKMHPTICQEMDELRTQANPTFEPFGKEDHGYASSNSSPASPRELVAESENESSNSVIMSAMVTEATNIKE